MKKFWYWHGEAIISGILFIVFIVLGFCLFYFVDYKISKSKISACKKNNGKPMVFHYRIYDSYKGCIYD